MAFPDIRMQRRRFSPTYPNSIKRERKMAKAKGNAAFNPDKFWDKAFAEVFDQKVNN